MDRVPGTDVLASARGIARRSLKRVPVAHRLAKEAVVAVKLARYRRTRSRRDHTLGRAALWQMPLEGWSSLDPDLVRGRAQTGGVDVTEVPGGFWLVPGELGSAVMGNAAESYPADAAYLVFDRETVDQAPAHAVAAAAACFDGGPRVYDLATAGTGAALVTVDDPDARYRLEAQVANFDREGVIDRVVSSHEETLHFGDVLTVVAGGDRFLYQDVPGRGSPGRRDTEARIADIVSLLDRHGATFDTRVVLDVCCNSGMMMGEALARGARWAVGWDLPRVAAAADDLLCVLGAGRSTLNGVSVDDSTDFTAGLPSWLAADGAVCLFLSAWHHVGFPAGIVDLPWEYLVYEGKENEESDATAANIATMTSRWGCEVVESTTRADGICGPRPIALLRRDVN